MFLLQKRKELFDRVKSQLKIAGVDATVESASDSDPEVIQPDSMELAKGLAINRKNTTKGLVTAERIKRAEERYYDLDEMSMGRVSGQGRSVGDGC